MYQQITANRRKTALFLVVFFALLIGLGYFFSIYYHRPDILWGAFILSIVLSWSSYVAGDKIILRMSGARLADGGHSLQEQKIVHLVENLCITAGLPTPKIFIMDDPALNAFAVGRNPKTASVALTLGLITKLDKAELEGVIAHELSHIRNYDILLATLVITLVGTIVMASDWLLRSRRYQHNNHRENNGILMIAGLSLAILSPILARLIYLAISRKREYLADAAGALLTRYPEGLAMALRKISADNQQLRKASLATAGLYIANPFKNKMANMAELFSTHPAIEKRILALDNMNV